MTTRFRCAGCGANPVPRFNSYCDDCIAEQEAASERRYFDMADSSYVNDLYGYNGDAEPTGDDWD